MQHIQKKNSTSTKMNVQHSNSETTKKHYAYMLELVQKRLKKDISAILAAPFKSIHTINKEFTQLQTRKAVFSAICSLLRQEQYVDYKHTEKWCAQAKLANEAVRARYEEGKATEKQEATYVPWTTIQAAFEKTRTDPNFPTKEHLLLAMYVLEPPKRLDYGNVEIITQKQGKQLPKSIKIPDGKNVIILKEQQNTASATLYLREYKTSKKYGDLVFELSDDLAHIIQQSLAKQPRTHLFMKSGTPPQPYDDITSAGKPDKSFAKFASRALSTLVQKGVTVNTLRHSMIKHVYENPKTTHKERTELSRRMCHSIDMQSAYAYEVDG